MTKQINNTVKLWGLHYEVLLCIGYCSLGGLRVTNVAFYDE